MAVLVGPEIPAMRTGGVLAGSAAILFAVAGIVTIGVVFVPIAVVLTLIGLARGALDRCALGLGLSGAAALLCGIGYATSPLLWQLV